MFFISGKPVLLRLNDPIFIKDGETIRVIGEYNDDGVFEAVAYYNRSAGVTGKEEKYQDNLLVGILIGILITFLYASVIFLLMVLFDVFSSTSEDYFIRVLIMLIGLVPILGGWIYFIKDRKKKQAMSREIDRLMGESKVLQ